MQKRHLCHVQGHSAIRQLTQSITEYLYVVRASEQNLIPDPNVECHFPGNHCSEKALYKIGFFFRVI